MTDSTGGEQFYSALQSKAMAAVQNTFKSTLYPVQYPAQGDFAWNWQNANQVFNDRTYGYANVLVQPGDIDGTVQLSPAGGFANAYVGLLNDLVFQLSSTDQAKLTAAQSNATVQAGTIVSDYQTIYGPITDAQRAAVGAPTKQDYVIGYVLGSQWSGSAKPLTYTQMASARNLKVLLPLAPASADQIITDVAVYLNLMQPVNGLQDQLLNGAWTLAQLKANTTGPTATNGGMQTFDPNSGATLGWNVGWSVGSSVASINNDLANTGRTIEIDLTTTSSSDNTLGVNVDGQVGFSVGSWLEFSTEASASYDMSRTSGTSTECSVSIVYAGYSMVPLAPTPWQQATNVGFYATDPVAQAVANSGQDVTGFQFLSDPPYRLGSVADGGNFGVLTNLLIANFPTITITYEHADYATFAQSWDEKVSGNLTLFGFIKLGSFSQGAYGSTVTSSTDNSSFTITFSASPEVTSVPQNLKTAYVVGAAVANPGVTH
ncbi:hypothetical protein [Cellulomonas terrae]|uniref:Uncharacterized protein n=1 Tax=Cellulomonas terrae TaxID=311234 RepID=A0A511JJF6_9CELL|nr:hypothetical protein [Cellulomonas terrae]GEL98152.1 hypothetical protein CTE05_16990 [Cellulomonas terrae]